MTSDLEFQVAHFEKIAGEVRVMVHGLLSGIKERDAQIAHLAASSNLDATAAAIVAAALALYNANLTCLRDMELDDPSHAADDAFEAAQNHLYALVRAMTGAKR